MACPVLRGNLMGVCYGAFTDYGDFARFLRIVPITIGIPVFGFF
jgi:hypothetical protein